MTEAQFGAKFQNWWQINHFCDQAGFEYKVTIGSTYNLNTWRKKQPHQEQKLKDTNGPKGVIWKISDLDPRTKPLDAFWLSNTPAFLVIWYEKYHTFFMVPVKDIPKTSISYKYCCKHFTSYELLKPIKITYEI